MTVLLIIGVIAAIAVPAYHDYSIRAKVSEALGAAGACTTAVSDYLAAKREDTLPARYLPQMCRGS